MTTAHRPTWNPAKGGNEQGGNRCFLPTRQYSSRDAPSHTTIKYRKDGQGTQSDLNETDFKKKLLEDEINAILAQDESEGESNSDSEVDEEDVMREFEKIKAERA